MSDLTLWQAGDKIAPAFGGYHSAHVRLRHLLGDTKCCYRRYNIPCECKNISVTTDQIDALVNAADNSPDRADVRINPTWRFPLALAWVATRDYRRVSAMAIYNRKDWSHRAEGIKDSLDLDDLDIIQNQRESIGMLHYLVSESCTICPHSDKNKRWLTCECVSNAWQELSSFAQSRGHSINTIPHFRTNENEGIAILTWPVGAADILFNRVEIEQIWLAADGNMQLEPQDLCEQWLHDLAKSNLDTKQKRADCLNKARHKIPQLSNRAFDRAWNSVAQQYGWNKAGAPRKNPRT